MKKNILILAALLTLISVNVRAGENFGSKSEEVSSEKVDFALLRNTQDNRYVVSLKNSSSEKMRLSFLDNNGHEIYTEFIEGASIYNRRFDLINLNKGSYKVKLENLGNIVQKEIIIK